MPDDGTRHNPGTFRVGEGEQPEVGMIKAVCNGEVIAESDETVVVEGNHYFDARERQP